MKNSFKPLVSLKLHKVLLDSASKIIGGRDAHETVEYLGDQACKDMYYEKIETSRCEGKEEKCVIECD